MYLIKDKGRYVPCSGSDKEASDKIPNGGIVKAQKARNYEFHKKAFALLRLGFSNQEEIQEFEVYRKWITVKAGYYDNVKHPLAIGPLMIPKSLSYEDMSAEEFEKWYEATLSVLSRDLKFAPEEVEKELENYF